MSSNTTATPTPPHGDAPTNSNPSGDVAFQDKSLTGKAADLTNRAVDTVTSTVNNVVGSGNTSGATPNPPHGDAPTNSNPSGDVAFQDKSLTGKAADLTNRAVDTVTSTVNNVVGSTPSGVTPNPPHGDAPTNSNPSGDVAFQDKSLTGKAADLTNRAVDAVTTQVNNVVGSGTSSGVAPNPPHGDAPTNSNPSGDVAFQDKSLTGKAADLTNRAVDAVTSQVNNVVGSGTSSGATPNPPHGDAPTNSNPSGDVAFQDKSLTGKAADLTNRAVEAVTTQVNNVLGTGPSSGAAPNPPHGDAPSNSNPSGDVAFQDKSLTGKAVDLTNRAVEAVTTQVNNVLGTGPSSGAAPNPPHGDAPTNSNPSGDVAFQDKSLSGKAVDLTNRAVDAVTTQVNNVVGSGTPSGATPNPPHGDAPTNSNPSGDVAFEDKTLTGKAVDLTNRAVDAVTAQASNVAQKVGENWEQVKQTTQQTAEGVQKSAANLTAQASEQAQQLKDTAVSATQQAAQVVANQYEAAKQGAQNLIQTNQDKVVVDSSTSSTTSANARTGGGGSSDLPVSAFEPDPKTGETKIVLSGFSSGDAETLSERSGFQ